MAFPRGAGGVSTCDGGGLLVPLGESSAREGEGREMWLRGKCGYAGCRPVMAAAFLFHSVSRPLVSMPKIGALADSMSIFRSFATPASSALPAVWKKGGGGYAR